MAVTVTKASPASENQMYIGAYGRSGSATHVAVNHQFAANKRLMLTRLNLSGTYITNGFALTPSDYGLKEIHGLLVVADGNSGTPAQWSLTAPGSSPVIKMIVDQAGTELANATSMTSCNAYVILLGI